MNQPAGQRPDVKDILDERTARPGRRLIKWAIILLALGGAGFYATEHLSTGNEPTIRYVTEPVTRGALTVYRRPPSYTESNGYRYQRPAGR